MSLRNQVASDPHEDRFGLLLRQWRGIRRLSQLALAEKAAVSARHLCHLETGRARPSRLMVRQLGEALDLPLAEQNALHVGAGFVPPFEHGDLDGHGFERVRDALAFVLRQQDPFPALVIDGRWDICLRNSAAERLFAPIRARYDMAPDCRRNAQHIVFHPRGLRPFIRNWPAFASHMLRLLQAESTQGSRYASQLLQQLHEYPLVAELLAKSPEDDGRLPLVTMQLEVDGRQLEFFSTFTRFAMPRDAALQELKIECLYAANAATETCLRQPPDTTRDQT